MSDIAYARKAAGLDPKKFDDPDRTADGTSRAVVAFSGLETLWFNTGTLCNLTCTHCYMESSPTNDRLVYLTMGDVAAYLDEIVASWLATKEIGFTGGEPFLNPDILEMLRAALAAGFRVLVLTNAMRPMQRHKKALIALQETYGSKLVVRVSMDHYGKAFHDKERGDGTWEKTLDGLKWLSRSGFTIHVAGRTCWGETTDILREGYGRLFRAHGIDVDAACADALVLFPEMDMDEDVPEITEACWDRLGVAPGDIMCATSRMVVKRKGAAHPVVQACTLIAHDAVFEMGRSLQAAASPVKLNHPHCARFCVLGGASCSRVS
ncbi:MAG: radical SAM protein [Rhodospirillaceae bacterium]|nr:MAG: radical SAM protein [Rhodospirillaceae bacterium]